MTRLQFATVAAPMLRPHRSGNPASPDSRRLAVPLLLAAVVGLAGCSDAEPTPESGSPADSDAHAAAAAPNAPPAASATPSFDCAAAEGEVQSLICSDAELAALDRQLDGVFTSALERAAGFADASTALPALRAFQRGWIGGRDECWKADSVRRCVVDAYRTRIASLQAEYRLLEPTAVVFWICEDEPANEFVTTLFPTDPRTMVVERGDASDVAVRVDAASGSRYEGPFGAWFWVQGDEARVEWPQGTELACEVRERR